MPKRKKTVRLQSNVAMLNSDARWKTWIEGWEGPRVLVTRSHRTLIISHGNLGQVYTDQVEVMPRRLLPTLRLHRCLLRSIIFSPLTSTELRMWTSSTAMQSFSLDPVCSWRNVTSCSVACLVQ